MGRAGSQEHRSCTASEGRDRSAGSAIRLRFQAATSTPPLSQNSSPRAARACLPRAQPGGKTEILQAIAEHPIPLRSQDGERQTQKKSEKGRHHYRSRRDRLNQMPFPLCREAISSASPLDMSQATAISAGPRPCLTILIACE